MEGTPAAQGGLPLLPGSNAWGGGAGGGVLGVKEAKGHTLHPPPAATTGGEKVQGWGGR